MSDYLWDRTGSLDPEIVELEQVLAPLRLTNDVRPPARSSGTISRWGIAACLIAGIAGSALLVSHRGTPSSWEIAASGHRILTGERVPATRGRTTTLESSEFGRVELGEGADLRLVEASSRRQRLELRRGKVEVLIWAPPGKFVIDTPSARAVDLGCQYELSVDGAGRRIFACQDRMGCIPDGSIRVIYPGGSCVSHDQSGRSRDSLF